MAISKKQIKEMNEKWKDWRLTEAKAKHGFDLTDMKPGGWKKVLKGLGIPMKAENNGMAWEWKGRNITVFTGNNPITGVYATGRRGPERNYASYVGIEGDDKKVATAVKLIKQYSSYRKGESPGRRDFI